MTFAEIQEQASKEWDELLNGQVTQIAIGTATCGRSAGAMSVVNAFEEELVQKKVKAQVREVGCIGPCYAEPLVNIDKPGKPTICYKNVTPEMVTEIIDSYIKGDDPLPQYTLGTWRDQGRDQNSGHPLLQAPGTPGVPPLRGHRSHQHQSLHRQPGI